MRLTRLLASRSDDSDAFSFEVFAPDAEDGVEPLRARLDRLARTEPLFVDVVGAGGLAAARTALALAAHARRIGGIAASLHLCAADLTRDEARAVLEEARACGVCNLVLERGGVPPELGAVPPPPLPECVGTTADFVELARSPPFGDFFCVGVVGYPQQPAGGCGGETGSFEGDLDVLRASASCGAEFILCQHTFDASRLVHFVAAAAAAGLQLPVIPSIALPGSWEAYELLACATGERLPAPDEARLRAIGSSASTSSLADFRATYVALIGALCRELLDTGVVPVLHFVTLNLEGTLRALLAELGLAGLGSCARRKLPWRPAVDESRAGEDVRPIFWGNRAASYIDRTAGWEHYPSGRWGTRSSTALQRQSETVLVPGIASASVIEIATSPLAPAVGMMTAPSHPPPTPLSSLNPSSGRVFGVIDHSLLTAAAGSVEERRSMWGSAPKSKRDVWGVFVRYVEGGAGVPRLPWCDTGSLLPETSTISSSLKRLNAAGFLTINSQPRINAARSDDATFGWGGPGGRVYQKAYIECFCPPGHLAALMEAAAGVGGGGGGDGSARRMGGGGMVSASTAITFHAVNFAGTWHSNASNARESVNAVTWGVFPDREVLQPTVMDPLSFVGPWREEAFGLWVSQWASIYEEGSDSHSLICDIADQYFLVSAVDNDFIGGSEGGGGGGEACGGTDSLFALFEDALAILKAKGERDPQAVAAVLQQQRAALRAAKRSS